MRPLLPAIMIGTLLALSLVPLRAAPPDPKSLFAKENLVAWCIVPFDAKRRSPEDRAAMLANLGIKRFAYDWRSEHLATFERELAALKKHDIELTALWLPAPLGKEGQFLLDTVKKHNLSPQLWVMTGAQTVEAAADTLRPLAREAADMNCKVALYNHGGWFGQPENQIEVIQRLKQDGLTNVGIVYNLHHGHEHLDRLPDLLAKMKPHLLCLNLNGMTKGGDKTGKKNPPDRPRRPRPPNCQDRPSQRFCRPDRNSQSHRRRRRNATEGESGGARKANHDAVKAVIRFRLGRPGRRPAGRSRP